MPAREPGNPVVILSAAKDLCVADERSFAALRMTKEAKDDRAEQVDIQIN